MKNWIKHTKVLSLATLIAFGSCESLDEINDNPNGVSPGDANVNMLMPTVMVGAAKNTLNLGYQDVAGVVQHTQKEDRKSTRLNSSHVKISYAVFCFGDHRHLHSFPTRRSSDLSLR